MSEIAKRLRDKAAERRRVGWELSDAMLPGEMEAAADEIDRLRSDLALLVPVSLPASQMEQCGYCYTLCAETWKHCPNCGAQARIADRSARYSKPSK